MESKTLYYISQFFIITFTVFTFMIFTVPYLSSINLFGVEPVKTNSLSRTLNEHDGDTQVRGSVQYAPTPRKAQLPKKDVPVSTPNSGWDSGWSRGGWDSGWGPSGPNLETEIKTGSSNDSIVVHKKIDTHKYGKEEVSNYYLIKEFFSFTSSIVGSVFPILGFIVAIMLRKKQNKLESV